MEMHGCAPVSYTHLDVYKRQTITGAALMHAVQEGKLSLDQDINGLLPFKVVNPYFPGQPITCLLYTSRCV